MNLVILVNMLILVNCVSLVNPVILAKYRGSGDSGGSGHIGEYVGSG